MIKEQANRITKLLEEGKQYKSGHYHYGYIYLSFDRKKKLFELKHEDLLTNMFEPSISYEYFSKEKMQAYLIK